MNKKELVFSDKRMSEIETKTADIFAALERMRRPAKKDDSESDDEEEYIIHPSDKVLGVSKVIITQLLEGYVMKQPGRRVFPRITNTGLGSLWIIQPGLSFFFYVRHTATVCACFYGGGVQEIVIKTTDDLAEFCNKKSTSRRHTI